MKHEMIIRQGIHDAGLYDRLDAMWWQQKLKPDMPRFKADMCEIATDLCAAITRRTRNIDLGIEACDEWIRGQTLAWIFQHGEAGHA